MDKIIKKIIIDKKLKKYQKLSKILKYIFVDIAGIDQKKYFILGSFSIRKYRTISDLDINLDIKEFIKLEKVVEKNMGKIEFYNGQIRWVYDMTSEYNQLTKSSENDFSIEAFQKFPDEGFPNAKFSQKYLTKHKLFDKDENGHQFFNLKTLLKWKITMNRPKNQDDIILIKSIIST